MDEINQTLRSGTKIRNHNVENWGGQGVAYNSWMRGLNNLSIYCITSPISSPSLPKLRACCLKDGSRKALRLDDGRGGVSSVIDVFQWKTSRPKIVGCVWHYPALSLQNLSSELHLLQALCFFTWSEDILRMMKSVFLHGHDMMKARWHSLPHYAGGSSEASGRPTANSRGRQGQEVCWVCSAGPENRMNLIP